MVAWGAVAAGDKDMGIPLEVAWRLENKTKASKGGGLMAV
jgi:hypothetical protein